MKLSLKHIKLNNIGIWLTIFIVLIFLCFFLINNYPNYHIFHSFADFLNISSYIVTPLFVWNSREYFKNFKKGIKNSKNNISKKLFLECEKQISERETLLKKIIEIIRSSLNIYEIKKNIVYEIGKTFNADRCFFRSFDKTKDIFLPPDIEYLSSQRIKSLIDVEPDQQGLKCFFDELKKKEKGSYPIVVDEEFAKDTPFEDYFKSAEIKAHYAIPIFDIRDQLTYLILHYTSKDNKLNENDKTLLETIAHQIALAFDQAILFDTIKETAEREILLRKIINTIRSTLDINEIKKQVVIEFGQTFNADRCFIIEYDQKSSRFLSVQDEYLSSAKVKSIIGLDIESAAPSLSLIAKMGMEVISEDKDKTILEGNLQGTLEEKYLTSYNIESGFSVPIYYSDELLGVLGIHYTTRKESITDEQIQLARTLSDQVGIAIHQGILFNTIKQTAEKERILRDIVAELRPSQNIEQAYNYLLSKIANIYNASRTNLIEIPVQENEKPRLSYEYLTDKNIPSIINVPFPELCLKIFKDIIDTYNPVIVPDTEYFHPNNIEAQNFFKTYSIRAFIGSPLVRYNHETRILGLVFICSNEPRSWIDRDIDLLKAINESVVNVIWEILKTLEVNRLRDTFVNTLAHDLQVPIVGDIRALEFLVSRKDTQTIGNFKEIIAETINNDKRILSILKNLLESYKYESGKKEIKQVKTDLKPIINDTIYDKKSFAESKNILIEKFIPDSLPEIKLDEKEIIKVINILLDNAISYTQNEGLITVNVENRGNDITTCITDNGPGIPTAMKESIFKRYEMTLEIERKIGAGISLYLAKQIIGTHNGKIWYTSELGKGSTFCFSLPIT